MSNDDNITPTTTVNKIIKPLGIIPDTPKQELLDQHNPAVNSGQITVNSAGSYEGEPPRMSGQQMNQPLKKPEIKPGEETITIPLRMYNELIAANDSAFVTLVGVYDKFDAILGAVMNLQGFVFNKKEEVKSTIRLEPNDVVKKGQ